MIAATTRRLHAGLEPENGVIMAHVPTTVAVGTR
jgi:hypothetical protein